VENNHGELQRVGAVVQVLSNVGREGHTYVHFITEILPQEVGVGSSVAKQRESIVVFLQDDIPGIIARMDCVLYLTGVC